MWTRATWRKNKKTLHGSWRYSWSRDRFIIQLDGRDPETGLRRQPFEIAGDNPEFNGWRLANLRYPNNTTTGNKVSTSETM